MTGVCVAQQGCPPSVQGGEVMQAGTFSLKGSQLLEPVGGFLASATEAAEGL